MLTQITKIEYPIDASQQVGYRRRTVLFANIVWNTYHVRILHLVGLIVTPSSEVNDAFLK
jgi:hypothetical protein